MFVLPVVKHNKLKIKEYNVDDGHKGTKHVVGLNAVLTLIPLTWRIG